MMVSGEAFKSWVEECRGGCSGERAKKRGVGNREIGRCNLTDPTPQIYGKPLRSKEPEGPRFSERVKCVHLLLHGPHRQR
jgi:hypothetical protein